MAQNKNKPKRSKAERLAKKRRNRHLAELKLLEKRRLATEQQKQELSNMIARKKQQQQRKFEKPAGQQKEIPTIKSTEPQPLIDREEPDIKDKYKVISTGEIEEYNPIQAAKDLAEAIIEEKGRKSVQEELVDLLNEQEDIPDSIKKRVNEYWQNPIEQKRLAVIGAIQKEEFASHQQRVESILQITDIYQAVLDEFMAQLPVKTQDFLLDCTSEVIDEVGLNVLQRRLRDNISALSMLILEPYERYSKVDRIGYSAQEYLKVIYGGHIPERVLSKLNTVLEVEEHAKVYLSRKKGLLILR